MKIALITYDISPYRGSEASVSWNFVKNMHQYVDLTIIYGGGKSEIEQYLGSNPLPHVKWINIPPKDVERFGKGLRLDFYYSLYYRQWHKQVYSILKSLVAKREIDLIHYLNPIGFKEPGWAWKIEEVPYVWGPIMCVENRPLPLYRTYTLRGKISTLCRRIIHNALFRFMPRAKKAFRHSDLIFTATPNGQKLLSKVHGKESVYLPENAICTMERTTPISWDPSQSPLKLIWIGRVADQNKAIGILLDALRKVHHRNWILHVIGSGNIRQSQKKNIEPISDKIIFHGQIPRTEVQEILKGCHLHIISSMGEGNPTTIWEAMSKAIPTLTLDHCGMSGVICGKCGIKIPIASYRTVTDNIAAAIDNLIDNPQHVTELSSGAIGCSKKFMWENRIPLFVETYRNLIGQYKQQ